MPDHDDVDVAILGTGIGGTILGAILARNGARVVLVERGTHPRFAIGESTIPETTILLRLMARRYGVPEIANLSNYNAVRKHVSAACGVKRNFSFVYHHPGQACSARETTQFPTWAPPWGPDVHFFRQDVDAYMLGVAVRHGARASQETTVREIVPHPGGLRLVTDGGRSFNSRYVVDAGGMKAALAHHFGLREEPCPFRTRSRTIFTHMVGVEPFDRCAPDRRLHGMPSPFSQGTLHHVFTGGWMWVIPFDNHRCSTNELCSVGVTVDMDAHPDRGLCPEEAFRETVARFPSIARQFERARAVRPWTATGRLQYSARRSTGERFCLLPHAASFVNPLFSSGLAVTMNSINLMACRILAALRDDDFSAERFELVDTVVKRSFAYYDTLVSTSYRAFADFDVWNAWHRVWMIGSLYGVTGLFEALSEFDRTGDPAAFALLEEQPYRGVQALDLPPYMELLEAASRKVDAFHEGRRSARETAAEIYDLVRGSELSPSPWKLGDPEERCPAGTFTILPMIHLVAWGRYRSPEIVRRHYFRGGRAGGLLHELLTSGAEEMGRLRSSAGGMFRDAIVSWNDDWRAFPPDRAVNRW